MPLGRAAQGAWLSRLALEAMSHGLSHERFDARVLSPWPFLELGVQLYISHTPSMRL